MEVMQWEEGVIGGGGVTGGVAREGLFSAPAPPFSLSASERPCISQGQLDYAVITNNSMLVSML